MSDPFWTYTIRGRVLEPADDDKAGLIEQRDRELEDRIARLEQRLRALEAAP